MTVLSHYLTLEPCSLSTLQILFDESAGLPAINCDLSIFCSRKCEISQISIVQSYLSKI